MPNDTKQMTLTERVVFVKKWSKSVQWSVNLLPDWITPNRVTAFRGLLVVPIIWFGLAGHPWITLAIYALATFLDFVDGAIAWIRGQCTLAGAFWDPFADKIVNCGTLFALIGQSPLWAGWTAAIMTSTGAVALTGLRIWRLCPRSIPVIARHPWIRPLAFLSVLGAVVLTPICACRLTGKQSATPSSVPAIGAKADGKVKMVIEVMATSVILIGVGSSVTAVTLTGYALIAVAFFFACRSFRSQLAE